MNYTNSIFLLFIAGTASLFAAQTPFPPDPEQSQERTCFQTGQAWSGNSNLRSDVAIVYGIDAGLPGRIQTWRDKGYRIHVMSGASWGNYQDYTYGRFDGTNHMDEAQTERNGKKIGHGGDVYYMCPGENYGKFLCVGLQRALDAGAEAIHMEEPEFWVRAGYSEGFKREWLKYYGEEWQPPHSSVDAQWRASKLKYFLYRRALQQVFDYIQDYNRRTGKHVRCYVPTHSLLNYAHWGIVSPESSLGRLNGCDGYIAQVWTGTSRTPNVYRGQQRERTFETAFLEYGAMQNLVRATGRTVWYLNDPIEDNPDHDWNDYQSNWESTLVASLLQPDVWQFEVAPWPERIFGGRYPERGRAEDRKSIPPSYATELQTVMSTLNDMKQKDVAWDCGTTGVGVMIGDSLMFQRGAPTSSDPHMSHIYGMALPFLKRGMPVTPVQLENLLVPHALDGIRILLMTYQGMKPLVTNTVHTVLADWVRKGGTLVFCDDDSDPYNKVRDWWNSGERHLLTPRQDLFEQLGLTNDLASTYGKLLPVGSGAVAWLHESPVKFAADAADESRLVEVVKTAAERLQQPWREVNYLVLRRGPYLVAAGLDESVSGDAKVLSGRFVNLFDSELRVREKVEITPRSRWLLLNLDARSGPDPKVLASACKTVVVESGASAMTMVTDGVPNSPAVILMNAASAPASVTLDGEPLKAVTYSAADHLLWLRFPNGPEPHKLNVRF